MISIILAIVMVWSLRSATSAFPERRIVSVAKPFGRVIEAFHPEFIAQIDADLRKRYSWQVIRDRENDRFTPQLTFNVSHSENTPIGVIKFGPLMHSGYLSTVYQIIGHPNLLIKYQVHCLRIDEELHPLLRDAWYTNETSAHGLSPEISFISPPSLMCETKVGKCLFTINNENFGLCKRENATLRYMIMERIDGMSLHEFRAKNRRTHGGALGFVDAMSIGYHLLYLLRSLHLNAHIVHGDIHTPNIMMRWVNGTRRGEFELRFVDFGLAFKKIPGQVRSEVPIRSKGTFHHELHTQWQIDGYEWSERDDVMKAIQTIVHLMHPFSYFEIEEWHRIRGYTTLREWKNKMNWFIPPTGSNPLTALTITPESRRQIEIILLGILTVARNLGINERVPYERILVMILKCIKLAQADYDATKIL